MARAGLSDDLNVEFAVGSFVNQAGDTVPENEIVVTFAHVDVANPAEADAFPGSYIGENDAGLVVEKPPILEQSEARNSGLCFACFF